MSWIDEISASQREELRDAGRIGASRFEGPILVDVEGAARLLSVSQDTVRALEGSGALPSVRLGRRVLFAVEGLRQWALDHQGKEVLA